MAVIFAAAMLPMAALVGMMGDAETPVPSGRAATRPPPQATAQFTCKDVESSKRSMTDLQWEAARPQLSGRDIWFRGEILEVYEDGRVQIDQCGLFTVVMLHGVPIREAATFSKATILQGQGTVREVTDLLGTHIAIQVWSYEAR